MNEDSKQLTLIILGILAFVGIFFGSMTYKEYQDSLTERAYIQGGYQKVQNVGDSGYHWELAK